MTLTWRSLIPVALAGTLCACAQSEATNTTTVVPENVAPANVNHVPYMGFSCPKLEQNLAYIAQELEDATKKPGENTTGNIAHLKGETEAVKKAMLAKKCSQPGPAKTTQ
jgi:hypothetical protein